MRSAIHALKPVIVLLSLLSLVAVACSGPLRANGTAAPSTAGTPSPGGTPVPTVAGTRPPAGTAGPQPARANPFGVMLAAQVVDSAQGMSLVKALGVTYFRPPQAIFIDQWNGTCAECDAALQAGLKLVLTVRNGSGGIAPSGPPKDLEAYKQTLGEILDKYHPEVLAVENEENSAIFYAGTPDQYAAELKAACEVAHSKGVKCTNGGLVSALVGLLVWDHYVAGGDAAQAQDFASKAFDASQQRLLDTPQARAQIDKGKALLDAYKTAGIDYLNFHWYIADTTALNVSVAYLRTQVGVPVITNEIGQFTDDPGQTKAVMQALVDLKIPIAVWFGLDGPKAKGLMDTGGTLRPTGQAFQEFITQNFVN